MNDIETYCEDAFEDWSDSWLDSETWNGPLFFKAFAAGFSAALASERQKRGEPVAWQSCEYGSDNWYDISREGYGINPQRYKYRELYATPPTDDEAVRLLREARGQLGDCSLKNRIDAYLARVGDNV